MDEQSIQIVEIVQAGDIFLIRFSCPICNELILTDFRSMYCTYCMIDFIAIPVILPKNKIRLLSGTNRKRKSGLSLKTIQLMLEEQQRLCCYCYDKFNHDYEIEHIVPISFGGTNNISNLCLSCKRCNLLAGNLIFQNFYAKQSYILGKRKLE